MLSLTQLPPEILQNVLCYINPEDVAAVAQVCQMLWRFMSGNSLLYKAIYLQHLVCQASYTSIRPDR
jgi:hypothetical protein